MSITPSELAEHIRTARRARGWTLKECADRAGIGKTAMFDLEHGNPGVRLNTLLAVLDQLGLSLQLAGGTTTTQSPISQLQLVTPERSEGGSSAQQAQDHLPDHLL
jgi:transcriptional regulator with XRE-family HTH domain